MMFGTYRTLLVVFVLVGWCNVATVVAEGGSDMDSMDSEVGGGDGSDMLDYGDGVRAGGQEFPQGQGGGRPQPNSNYGSVLTTSAPSASNGKPTQKEKKTEKPQNMMQMTIKAILQLGMIVGVAILCGSLFMGLVWMEMLMDHLAERYRKFFDKPEPIPDIERLHPADLVGTFARYK